jgi:integrase
MPSGSKKWRLKYRQLNGKENVLSFGDYPGTPLGVAREEREKAKLLLAAGKDPAIERELVKQAAIQAHGDTFEVIAKEWLETKQPGWSPGYYDRVSNALKADVYPYVGRLPIHTIPALAVLKVIQRVEKRGALEMASRVLEAVGMVFKYAAGTGRAHADVTANLNQFLQERPEVQHYPHVSAVNLPTMLQRINDYSGRPETVFALKLMMHTFPRTTELRWAEWGEFDFDERLWAIPSERMKGRIMAKKSGISHLIPLSTQMIALLEDLKAITGRHRFLFPGMRNPATSPMSAETINKALKIMGYEGEQTGHGFRGLASTIMNESGHFRSEAIDAQLAHKKKDKTEAAYNHAKYLPERRKLMQWWSDYLEQQTALQGE